MPTALAAPLRDNGRQHGRPLINVMTHFSQNGTLYHDDPRHGRDDGYATRLAQMGDIVHLPEGDASLAVCRTSTPIERVDIFNGLDRVEQSGLQAGRSWPYSRDLGRRGISGPFRQVIWDGSAFLSNEVISAKAINFFSKDKTLNQLGATELTWRH